MTCQVPLKKLPSSPTNGKAAIDSCKRREMGRSRAVLAGVGWQLSTESSDKGERKEKDLSARVALDEKFLDGSAKGRSGGFEEVCC